MTRERSNRWFSFLGIALVAVSYAGALVNTLSIHREQTWTHKKVIRICHWQLEAGFREAMAWVIAGYEKRHPDVKIIQLTVPDKAYQQFMLTQFIGGKAPDIIEFGHFGFYGARDNITARYIFPLSTYLTQPNPYNGGNDLKGVPWIHTFAHELEFNWDPINLDYYSIGITGFTPRLAYNKCLMKKITGTDAPPLTFRDFLAFCKRVQAYADSTGRTIYPIAAARYQFESQAAELNRALTHSIYIDSIDRNHDMDPDAGMEVLISWLEGRFSFDDPKVRASNEIAREIIPFIEPGFMAHDRQDAVFSFSQQKAVIIPTWSWDMNSQVAQARESGFDVGVMRMPLPDSTDPVYGKYVEGYEAEQKGFDMPFAVTHFSREPETAVDFLRYYSSKEVAEEFCKRIGWLCTVRGTKNIDFMQGFAPVYQGYPISGAGFAFGNETDALLKQLEWDYFSGTMSYEDFIARHREKFIPIALKDGIGNLATLKTSLPSAGQALSDLSLRLKLAPDEKERARLLLRLTNAVDSYAGSWATLQGSVFDFLRAMSRDNDRTREARRTVQFKAFLDEFPAMPLTAEPHS